MYDERDKKFYYFTQPYSCGKSGTDGKVWILQEWIDEFHLDDYLDDVAAWNKLVNQKKKGVSASYDSITFLACPKRAENIKKREKPAGFSLKNHFGRHLADQK